MSQLRIYSDLDHMLMCVEHFFHVCWGSPQSSRPSPADSVSETSMLTAQERRHSAGLMRVNHSGEVCAQALYQGQAIGAKRSDLGLSMQEAAHEELDHFVWCSSRLAALGGKSSYLTPFWYLGSFSLGLLFASMGDEWSLGFLQETERQVATHLRKHLQELPATDYESRAIVSQMCTDETEHALLAGKEGAKQLPLFLQEAMHLSSRLITELSYWF